MKKFSKEFLACIEGNQITGISAGADHPKFTGIWMVVVKGRVFGRSYFMADRSWFSSLIAGEAGAIRCQKAIVKVRGEKPKDLKTLNAAVLKAYEKKYLDKEYNRKWVDGFREPERVERTIEFFPA